MSETVVRVSQTLLWDIYWKQLQIVLHREFEPCLQVSATKRKGLSVVVLVWMTIDILNLENTLIADLLASFEL